MRSQKVLDYNKQKIDFIIELDLPKEASDRHIKKVIQEYNDHVAALRINIGDRILNPSEPDPIIAVRQFFLDNQAILNVIKEKYKAKYKAKSTEAKDDNISSVITMLEHAEDFNLWANQVIPEWLDKRKIIIPPPSFILDKNAILNANDPLKNYYYYVKYFARQEKLPINLSLEIDFNIEVFSFILGQSVGMQAGNYGLLYEYLHFQINDTLKQLFLAAHATGYYDPSLYKKFLNIFDVKITDDRFLLLLNRIKMQFLFDMLEDLIRVEDSPNKENCIKYIYSSLSVILKDISIFEEHLDIHVDENIFHLSEAMLFLKDDQAFSDFTNQAKINGKDAIVKFAAHVFNEEPLTSEHEKYIACEKLKDASLEEFASTAATYLENHDNKKLGVNIIYAARLAQIITKKYPFNEIINFIDKNNNLQKKYNLLFSSIMKEVVNNPPLLGPDDVIQEKIYGHIISYMNSELGYDGRDILQKLYPLKSRATHISYCDQDIKMPFALYVTILQENPKIPESFHQFFDRFKKAEIFYQAQREQIPDEQQDENAHAFNEVNYKKFMMMNMPKLMNLYGCMGNDFFYFMRKMIGTSANTLNRYFKTLSIIPENYFPSLNLLQEKYPDHFKSKPSAYDVILIQICQLEELFNQIKRNDPVIKKYIDDYYEEFNQLCKQDTPENISTFLSTKSINFYKELLHLPVDEEFDFSKLMNDRNLISRLLVGRRSMKDQKLDALFDKLIEYDLKTGKTFNDFIRDINQKDIQGQALAKHNKIIADNLSKNGIDINLAYNYEKSIVFDVGGSATELDINELTRAIYNDLKNLEKIPGPQLGLDNSTRLFTDNNLKGLNTNITTMIKEIEKGTLLPEKLITNLASVRKKASKNLELILQHENLPAELKEHGKHFLDHNNQLDEAIQSGASLSQKHKKTQQKKTFVAKQWDKSQIETFLLGDYLSCCLAPDGGRFSAIVERRLDDAMMMHVIYDPVTKEPVCGNWLFFASDKDNKDDIYIVANFFEIQAAYGLNKPVRDELVRQLTDFTGQYSKDVGAKDFIIRPLSYGLIPDFKDKYNTKEINIEKVGGFFSPPDSWSHPDQNANLYYLEALKITKFYVYQPGVKQEKKEMPTISHGS